MRFHFDIGENIYEEIVGVDNKNEVPLVRYKYRIMVLKPVNLVGKQKHAIFFKVLTCKIFT